MRFVNTTDIPADAVWGVTAKDEMAAVVVVKATYDAGPDGTTGLVTSDPWPVLREPLETPWGVFFPDATPIGKPKVDLIVCGSARTRLGRPATEATVRIRAGHAPPVDVRVVGDRTWERHGRRLVPSAPAPFVAMPLVMERAYGGTVTTAWGAEPCLANPRGRGFALAEAQAVGAALPNLEDPRRPVERWDDRPDPLAPCPYPMDGALRVQSIPPDAASPFEYDHLFLNEAHPRLMLDATLRPGEEVRVDGIRHDGPFVARVPACPARARVRCDAAVTEIPLRLDTVIVLGDARRVVFRWRGAARFALRPREDRHIAVTTA